MKKKAGIILIMLGILLIISAFIFFRVINNSNILYIDTSKIIGEKFDNEMYDYYVHSNDFLFDYIKGHDLSKKNKISFPILNEMNYENEYTEFSKTLLNGNFEIYATILSDVSDLDDYLSNLIDIYTYQENDKLNYSNGSIKIHGFDSKYIKFNYILSDTQENLTSYTEAFYIIIPIDDNEAVLLRYSVIDKRFDDEFLFKIVDSIKVEEGSAKYLNSSVEETKITGTLIQKKIEGNEFYEVSYKIDGNRYEEIEDENNTINYTTFSSKSSDALVNIETRFIMNDDIDIVELLKEEYDIQDDELELMVVVFNNQEYTRISFEFSEDEKNKHRDIYVYMIDQGIFYVVTVSSSDNYDEFPDFTDFEVN